MVLQVLTPWAQNICVLGVKHLGEWISHGEVSSCPREQSAGPGQSEKQSALDVREPRGSPPTPGSARPQAGAVRHAELCGLGTVHVKVCHPCYYGDNWPAAPGCPTQGLCPGQG